MAALLVASATVSVSLTNKTTGKTYSLKPLGDAKPIIDAGGVFEYAKQAGMLKV